MPATFGPVPVSLLTAPDVGCSSCKAQPSVCSTMGILVSKNLLAPPILSEFFAPLSLHLGPSTPAKLVFLDSLPDTGRLLRAGDSVSLLSVHGYCAPHWSNTGTEPNASWRGFHLTCAVPKGTEALAAMFLDALKPIWRTHLGVIHLSNRSLPFLCLMGVGIKDAGS